MNPLHLAHDIARVTTWWASVPDAERRATYRPHELSRATGVPRHALPHVCELLGWNRARRWGRINNHRVLRTYYAPPGHRVPLPPRGRPPIDVLALFALRVTD